MKYKRKSKRNKKRVFKKRVIGRVPYLDAFTYNQFELNKLHPLYYPHPDVQGHTDKDFDEDLEFALPYDYHEYETHDFSEGFIGGSGEYQEPRARSRSRSHPR